MASKVEWGASPREQVTVKLQPREISRTHTEKGMILHTPEPGVQTEQDGLPFRMERTAVCLCLKAQMDFARKSLSQSLPLCEKPEGIPHYTVPDPQT